MAKRYTPEQDAIFLSAKVGDNTAAMVAVARSRGAANINNTANSRLNKLTKDRGNKQLGFSGNYIVYSSHKSRGKDTHKRKSPSHKSSMPVLDKTNIFTLSPLGEEFHIRINSIGATDSHITVIEDGIQHRIGTPKNHTWNDLAREGSIYLATIDINTEHKTHFLRLIEWIPEEYAPKIVTPDTWNDKSNKIHELLSKSDPLAIPDIHKELDGSIDTTGSRAVSTTLDVSGTKKSHYQLLLDSKVKGEFVELYDFATGNITINYRKTREWNSKVITKDNK